MNNWFRMYEPPKITFSDEFVLEFIKAFIEWEKKGNGSKKD